MFKKIIATAVIVLVVSVVFIILSDQVNDVPAYDNEEEPVNDEEEKIVEGRVAIIIDDLGYNPELDKKLAEIDFSLTLAVLPFREHTGKAINTFKERENFELILHLPLGPISEAQHEEKMAMVDMSREEIASFLDESLEEMQGTVKGLNNHKGSKFTSDSLNMGWLLEEIKARELFFIDSFTVGASVGYSLAKEMNIPTARRDVFLDVIDDPREIRDRLYELEEKAREKGSAIAIGHHTENTIKVLKEELPAMEERGIKPVFISELLK